MLLPVVVLVSGLLLSLFAGQASAAAGPAHSLAEAREQAAVTKNSWQHAAITSKSQQNWYQLKVPTRSYLYVLLGALPADYNLRLYNEAGKQLNVSDKAGTSPENIGRMLNAGTYFLRVASTKGFSRTKKYDLLARVAPAASSPSSADSVAVLTAQFGNYPTSTIVGEIANTSDERLYADRMEVAYYDAKGKRLKRFQYETPRPQIALEPGARAPFQIIPGSIPRSVFAKVKRIKVTKVWTTSAAAGAPAKLKLSGVKRVRKNERGEISYDWSGKVTNSSARKARDVSVVVVARDKRGVVSGFDAHSWITVPAKGTKKFGLNYYGNLPSGGSFNVKAYEETGLN